VEDIEIEIKVRIENAENLESFLEKEGEFTGEKHQVDEYFTPAHRDFTAPRPAAEWLRIRTSTHGSVAYKLWHYDDQGRSQYCDEYETEVADPQSLRKIFMALNIKPLITVDKSRRAWRYQDYEIALDNVVNLGDFVEIEYKGNSPKADPGTITGEMIAFLKAHNPGRIERDYVGYPFRLLYPDEVTSEIIN